MALDMERQLDDLPRMAMPAPASKVAFAGSGDSYVAGLAAHYISSGRASCYHPADILADPAIAHGRDVYFVSASGKTRINALAAKAARKVGLRTVAVTKDAASPLARACDDVVLLNYSSTGRTAGTISFATNLLACAWLATEGKASCPADIKTIYATAGRNAARIADKIDTSNITIHGDSSFYPAAMYGALKFNEVLGSRAAAYPLEDFFHAPLFGTKKRGSIITFGSDKLPAALLRKSGFESVHVDCKGTNIESLLYAVFFLQHLVLKTAKRQKCKECYFMQAKKLLKTSSDFIY